MDAALSSYDSRMSQLLVDSIWLMKNVRSDPSMSKTPFILVTAESKQDNVKAAKQAGVNNYLIKPFNAAVLKVKIEQALTEAAAMA